MTPSRRTTWVRRAAVLVLLLLLATLSFRAFVGDVYTVASGSMQPTLLGPRDGSAGDRVLVLYERDPDFERFDLGVMLRPGANRQEVKRVLGLPGEDVWFESGDLLVDGRRLPPGAPRPAPVCVFDDRWDDLASEFAFDRSPDGAWHREDGHWKLAAADVARGSDAGMMFLHEDLLDGWTGPGGRTRGRVQVHDALVECEVRVDGGGDRPAGKLRLQLREEGDTFQLEIEPLGNGRARFTLVRWNAKTLSPRGDPSDQFPRLLSKELPFELGRWHRVVFGNVDNALWTELDDLGRVLVATYERNEPYLAARPGTHSPIPRVALGGVEVEALFRGVRILRDHEYPAAEDRDRYGVDSPISLGPDEFFVVGDNGAQSLDSRSFGPVPRSSFLGRPTRVLWPWGRRGVLRGAVAPPPEAELGGESGTSAPDAGS